MRNKESDAISDSKKNQLVAEQVSNQNQVIPSISTDDSKKEANLPRPIVETVGIDTNSDKKPPNMKANNDEGEEVGSTSNMYQVMHN